MTTASDQNSASKMTNSIKLSYAIPVCNEAEELKRLLGLLIEHKEEQDEIIVIGDTGNVTEAVIEVLMVYEHFHVYYEHSLNGDFARHKNFLNSKCTGDWVFQLDADEYISETFLLNIHDILEANSDIEAIWVPRLNTVDGLTQADIDKWGWNVNADGWVNWPDFQCRLYKNKSGIYWKNKVHEQLTGHSVSSFIPTIEAFAIRHPKHIDRQRRQNDFYETL